MLQQTIAGWESAVVELLMMVGARGIELSTLAGGWVPPECHGANAVLVEARAGGSKRGWLLTCFISSLTVMT